MVALWLPSSSHKDNKKWSKSELWPLLVPLMPMAASGWTRWQKQEAHQVREFNRSHNSALFLNWDPLFQGHLQHPFSPFDLRPGRSYSSGKKNERSMHTYWQQQSRASSPAKKDIKMAFLAMSNWICSKQKFNSRGASRAATRNWHASRERKPYLLYLKAASTRGPADSRSEGRGQCVLRDTNLGGFYLNAREAKHMFG